MRHMFRVIVSAFGVAVAFSFLFNGNKYAIYAGFAIGLAIVVVPLVTGQSALKCPSCRKRVKLGATACHHCGRAVGTTG